MALDEVCSAVSSGETFGYDLRGQCEVCGARGTFYVGGMSV